MVRSVENIKTFMIKDKSVAEAEIAELAQRETKKIELFTKLISSQVSDSPSPGRVKEDDYFTTPNGF